MPEDTAEARETVHYIWEGGGRVAFSRGPGQPESATSAILAPIGWILAPDPAEGVVLRSPSGRRVPAFVALFLARQAEEGFRVLDPSSLLASVVEACEARRWLWIECPTGPADGPLRFLVPPQDHPRRNSPWGWLEWRPNSFVPEWIGTEPVAEDSPR